jgi:hypothetical protein
LREEQEAASLDELVYKLPFKLKMQTLFMEGNKAIDERTKEDKEKMEKEALLEIETNFPSYFDEYQRVVFSGVVPNQESEEERSKRKHRDPHAAVKVEKILSEILNLETVSDKRKDHFKRSIVKLRLKMLEEIYLVNQTEEDLTIPMHMRDNQWLRDLDNYLREELTRNTLPSVMNVSDVHLSPTYNFYHDPLQ